MQIGQREDGPAREIIGVVGTAKHGSLAENDEAEFYLPFSQAPDRYSDIFVRTSLPGPTGLERIIGRAVHEIDAQQFVPEIKPLAGLIKSDAVTMLGAFAAIAILSPPSGFLALSPITSRNGRARSGFGWHSARNGARC